MTHWSSKFFALLFVAAALACTRPAFSENGYTPVSGPCDLQFPRDHGDHSGHRIEWWYYTGTLISDAGQRFGFQLTFFRIRTTPPEAESEWPGERSRWRSGQVIAAHAAVTDISAKRFYHAEKLSRDALGLAGLTGSLAEDGRFEVFAGQWRALIMPGGHTLSANTPDFSFELDLTPKKPPVAHGDSGYSQKGENPGEASCYYSITRLEIAGKLSVEGKQMRVSGTAWMDHEFSSAPTSQRLAGWDWFSLRLSDGSDLMLYILREKGGGISPASNGTLVDAEGGKTPLGFTEFSIKTLDTWKSPHTDAVYPASWLIEVSPAGLRLEINPEIADQEVQSPESTRVTYWEGIVGVRGANRRGEPVSGEGYVELTGYAGEVRF